MNHYEVLRRLWKEKHEWESMGDAQEVLWTLRGINLCIGHVKSIAHDQSLRQQLQSPVITRLYAQDLYRATGVALNYLRNGDRPRAIRVLEMIRNRTRGGTL